MEFGGGPWGGLEVAGTGELKLRSCRRRPYNCEILSG